MSKWDEYVQPEEETEYLIYAEWEAYNVWVNCGESPAQTTKIDAYGIASDDCS